MILGKWSGLLCLAIEPWGCLLRCTFVSFAGCRIIRNLGRQKRQKLGISEAYINQHYFTSILHIWILSFCKLHLSTENRLLLSLSLSLSLSLAFRSSCNSFTPLFPLPSLGISPKWFTPLVHLLSPSLTHGLENLSLNHIPLFCLTLSFFTYPSFCYSAVPTYPSFPLALLHVLTFLSWFFHHVLFLQLTPVP